MIPILHSPGCKRVHCVKIKDFNQDVEKSDFNIYNTAPGIFVLKRTYVNIQLHVRPACSVPLSFSLNIKVSLYCYKEKYTAVKWISSKSFSVISLFSQMQTLVSIVYLHWWLLGNWGQWAGWCSDVRAYVWLSPCPAGVCLQ